MLRHFFKRISPRRKKRSKFFKKISIRTDIAPANGLDNTSVQILRDVAQTLRGKALARGRPSLRTGEVYLGDHIYVCQCSEYTVLYAWNGTHAVDELWLKEDEARILQRWLNAVLKKEERTIDL